MSIPRFVRLLGIVAVLVFTAASSAPALTVSPTGNYTVTSGSIRLTFTSNGQTLTCTASRIGATISSNGIGTIPVGGVAFTGCTNALLGTFTVTQNSAWPIQVVLSRLADGLNTLVGLQVTIPARGVRISNLNCSFTFSGTTLKGRLYPLPLPVTVAPTHQFTFLRTSLTTDSVTGCSPLITVVGLTATFAGSYTMSRSATISG